MSEKKVRKAQNLENLDAYEIKERRIIDELQSEGVVLEHKKSGARVFLLSNDDDNKVFYIGFRTPPGTDTGVPHIMEHSVLCGSEKFPLKDPFVELVKGSLNTFLNAMTYPDKTVYPVASCNDKDFQNLMDVYMDAVLHPNIYKNEKIFRQEGWHYELTDKDEPIIYNGVVYNEMKGVYSSPENVIDRYIMQSLYPDTCYGVDSGGDPAVIPTLTYEDFLDFHRRYYHPSNSYIYLYGDMDFAEKLDWLDREYLSSYDRTPVDSRIEKQPPYTSLRECVCDYSISSDEDEENSAYLALNYSVGDVLDARLYVAFQVLEYALLDAPGAPLKQALIDAGIGQDIIGGYESGIRQPFFSVIAKDARLDQKDAFVSVIRDTVKDLYENGINKRSLKAGINYFEFRYREADYGSSPKGLMFGLQSLDSWLYDGDPMLHLTYAGTFEFLKKAVDEEYFEELLRRYFIDNEFASLLILRPKKNLTAERDAATADKLAGYKAALTENDIDTIIADTAALKAWQDTPEDPKVLEMVPLLTRADIGRKAETFSWKEDESDGIKLLYQDIYTSRIAYLNLLFDTSILPQEDLPYAGLLKAVLGCMNTENYSYSDLGSEIFLNSGGVDFDVTSYANLKDPENFTGAFIANVKVLYEKLDFGFSILDEILNRTCFNDEKRLKEIILETRSRLEMRFQEAGHSAAVARASSYFSPTGAYEDVTGGLGFYRFLVSLAGDYDQQKDNIIARLEDVAKRLFTRSNLLINITADEEGREGLGKAMKLLTDNLPEGSPKRYKFTHEVRNLNEGIKIASQVNYVARCGNFRDQGYLYTGAMRILQVMLSYDYLWINIRVKGGAYGCMSGFGRSGDSYLVSYRDPNMKKTDEVFEGVVGYLEAFDPDERDMTKYVIGAISNLDTPLTPHIKGLRGLSAYLSGITDEMLQKERDEVLGAGIEDIRALAGPVRAMLSTGARCVIGSEEEIDENADWFGEVAGLSKG